MRGPVGAGLNKAGAALVLGGLGARLASLPKARAAPVISVDGQLDLHSLVDPGQLSAALQRLGASWAMCWPPPAREREVAGDLEGPSGRKAELAQAPAFGGAENGNLCDLFGLGFCP